MKKSSQQYDPQDAKNEAARKALAETIDQCRTAAQCLYEQIAKTREYIAEARRYVEIVARLPGLSKDK